MMPSDGINLEQEPPSLPWESITPEDDVTDVYERHEPTPDADTPAIVAMLDAAHATMKARTGQAVTAEVAVKREMPLPSGETIEATPVVTIGQGNPDVPNDWPALAAATLIVPAAVIDDLEEPAGPPVRGGGWTLPLLCAGLCLLACCVVIPQTELNHRAVYERRELQLDLAAIQKQVFVNDEFLKRVGDDPTLAERLAQRQMKIVRAGSQMLNIGNPASLASDMSPFQLTLVPRPDPLPAYRPFGGTIAALCCSPRSRLYLTGIGMLMVAAGLVLGFSPDANRETASGN